MRRRLFRHSTAAAGASPQRAWRHFTSTNTQTRPSRQTRSSSPCGNLTLRSTTVRPARSRKAAAASSARRPSEWRGSAMLANTTDASSRGMSREADTRRGLRVAFGAPRALHGLEFRPYARHFLALRQLRVPGCRRARVVTDVHARDREEARERAAAGRARRRRRFVDAVAKLHHGAARLTGVVVGS